MKEWLKANGGPPAIIIFGFTIVTLNLSTGIIVVILGAIYWIYKAKWFPYKILKKTDLALRAKTNEEVIEKTRSVVGAMGSLLGQHVRYKPPFHDEQQDFTANPHAAWARSVNRSNTHEQSTVARFFEDYYKDLMTVVSALQSRGALTQDEIRQINWFIGTSTYGSGAHQLADVPPLLAKAADRLESGQLPDPTSKYER